jgi:diguanylate cyclase (GGDEF)-like protein
VTRILGFARLEPILKLDNRLLAIGVGTIVCGCFWSLGAVFVNKMESTTHNSIQRQLISVARDAAQFVDGDTHKEIRLRGGMENPAYETENTKLRKLLHANDYLHYVYTCYVDGGQIKFGLDPSEPGDQDKDGVEDQSHFGEVYEDAPPALLQALKSGKSISYDEPYTDAWGTFISGYSPIFSSDGKLEAVVGVDLSADRYLAEMSAPRMYRQIWLWISLLIGVMAFLLSLKLLNQIQKRFLTIIEAKHSAEEANEELAHANRQLDWQIRIDSLTGLLNRPGFFEVVENALQSLEAEKLECCSMALMDLDNFKVANDHYGHVFGDQYLMAFAERLSDHFSGALLGRLGGDEFVLMMECNECDEALEDQVARFQQKLALEPMTVGLVSLHSSVSVGIVKAKVGDTQNDLIRNADIAMYEAKRSGKGELRVYEPWMGMALESRVELERELRNGWSRGEFWMAIQPIVDLKTGRMNAGELLMRWTREDGTSVSPMEFIPVAEDTGLILEMGYWAIEEACRHLERLEREFPNERMHLSVNVSPRQLNQVDFVERLEEIFVKYSFRIGGLWLELTESSLMDDHKKVAAKMNRIQAMGILIALDDFGTGYSSLSMLLDIPLDCLKIDRSFVLQLGKSENSEELVRMILKLSEMLGLSVVAEGIETEENAQILRSMGCRWGQGYLYSKPVPIDEFIDRIGVNKKAA